MARVRFLLYSLLFWGIWSVSEHPGVSTLQGLSPNPTWAPAPPSLWKQAVPCLCVYRVEGGTTEREATIQSDFNPQPWIERRGLLFSDVVLKSSCFRSPGGVLVQRMTLLFFAFLSFVGYILHMRRSPPCLWSTGCVALSVTQRWFVISLHSQLFSWTGCYTVPWSHAPFAILFCRHIIRFSSNALNINYCLSFSILFDACVAMRNSSVSSCKVHLFFFFYSKAQTHDTQHSEEHEPHVTSHLYSCYCCANEVSLRPNCASWDEFGFRDNKL